MSLPNDNFKLCQTGKFVDDNFRFDENGGEVSKRVENTVGKGKMACYKQFLLFPLFSIDLYILQG